MWVIMGKSVFLKILQKHRFWGHFNGPAMAGPLKPLPRYDLEEKSLYRIRTIREEA